MSDLMSRIMDDIEDYRYLCKKFNCEVQYTRDYYGHLTEDCYGEHAKELEAKNREILEASK